MAVTVSGNLTNILDPATVEVFLDSAIKRSGLDFFRFIRVLSASTKTIEKTGYHGPGARSTRTEGDDYPFEAVQEAYQKTYTQSESVFGAQIAEFAYHYMDRVALAEYVAEVGLAYGHALNAAGYAVLSGGFSDTGPDAVSLFSASHPSVVGGNRSNTGSTALSAASLDTALAALRRAKNSQAQFSHVQPALLVVSPEGETTAKQVTGSTYTSAALQVNVMAQKGLTVVVNPEITDTNDWFLIDPMTFKGRMYVGKGSSPRAWIDPDSGNWRLADSDHKATGYDGWMGAWGASVT